MFREIKICLCAALFMLSLPAQADEVIFDELIAHYDPGQFDIDCQLDSNFSVNPEDTYMVNIGRDNLIEAYVVNPISLMCDDIHLRICGTSGCPIKINVNGNIYDIRGTGVFSMQVRSQSLLIVSHVGATCGRSLSNSHDCFSIWEWDETGELLNRLR